MIVPFVVGREPACVPLKGITATVKVFLATQHDASVDEPSADDIYESGTISNIVQSVRMPDGNIKVLFGGVERARVQSKCLTGTVPSSRRCGRARRSWR